MTEQSVADMPEDEKIEIVEKKETVKESLYRLFLEDVKKIKNISDIVRDFYAMCLNPSYQSDKRDEVFNKFINVLNDAKKYKNQIITLLHSTNGEKEEITENYQKNLATFKDTVKKTMNDVQKFTRHDINSVENNTIKDLLNLLCSTDGPTFAKITALLTESKTHTDNIVAQSNAKFIAFEKFVENTINEVYNIDTNKKQLFENLHTIMVKLDNDTIIELIKLLQTLQPSVDQLQCNYFVTYIKQCRSNFYNTMSPEGERICLPLTFCQYKGGCVTLDVQIQYIAAASKKIRFYLNEQNEHNALFAQNNLYPPHEKSFLLNLTEVTQIYNGGDYATFKLMFFKTDFGSDYLYS